MFSKLYEKDAEFFASIEINRSKEDLLALTEAVYKKLTEINKIHNLTRITSPEDFWEKHFIDSLLVLKVMPELGTSSAKLVDVGCGGGFPTFPLALVNPNLEIVSVDSVGKKINAINETAKEVGLPKITAIHSRARELARLDEHNMAYDFMTARAVAEAGSLIKECRQFLSAEGQIIFYKTPEAIVTEKKLTDREAKKYKFNLTESAKFLLSKESGERQFLIAKK